MGKHWDREERLFDERFFLDDETLTSAQAYLTRTANEPKEGEEITWWYEVGFKLNESDGHGHFCCYALDDDKEGALNEVRDVAEKIASALRRLITAIDAEMERKPEEVLDGGAEPDLLSALKESLAKREG